MNTLRLRLFASLDVLLMLISYIPVGARVRVVSTVSKRWRSAMLHSITVQYESGVTTLGLAKPLIALCYLHE